MVIRMMSCDQQQSVGADADAGRKRGVVTDAWLAACGGRVVVVASVVSYCRLQ